LSGEKIDVVEWSTDVRQFISNALSPAKPSDTVLIEDGDVRTAIVVVPDRQLSLAIGKEGQNARLAAKLTGWRIDIKSETEAATEGLAEIKRQQIQLLKTRSLEAKAPTAAPGDDLLSRAEWLLREKDKAAVTLEQAAKLLADSDSTVTDEMLDAEKPAVVEPTPASPAAAEGAAPVKPAEEVLEPEFFEPEFEPAMLSDEAEEEDDEAKREKRRKADKKRQLVFDERLGQVVSRRKRKPSRQDWGDEVGDY